MARYNTDTNTDVTNSTPLRKRVSVYRASMGKEEKPAKEEGNTQIQKEKAPIEKSNTQVPEESEKTVSGFEITSASTKNKENKEKHRDEVHTDALFYARNVLGEAINKGASDIHFEPKSYAFSVRFRIDGVLQTYEEHSINDYKKLVNSIKVLADMDITESAIPQDGHIELVHEIEKKEKPEKETTGNLFDIRVSVFPSINGEVIVMRILNRENALLTIEELGMDEASLDKLHDILLTSHGMLLATGPTGSGKTTTLYSILNELRNEEKNIITLEDPIEFHLDWLRQCEIREKRGFTFEAAMESVLRQDPDVLMVGEIRSGKTAEHAVQSALAGRFVGSTIHANTTIGTIARFIELGVSRRIVGHILNGIIAQRLARKICRHCQKEYTPSEKLQKHFGLEKVSVNYYKGDGCEQCNQTGYRGRVGIFSVMGFDSHIRNLLFDERPLIEIQRYAIENGMKTLKEDAARKVMSGQTTLEEAVRVI